MRTSIRGCHVLRNCTKALVLLSGSVYFFGCSSMLEGPEPGASVELQLTASVADSGKPSAQNIDVSKLRIENTALGALSGYYSKPEPGQEGALRGTDLGATFSHRDKLWIMFGDSWWLDPYNLTNGPDDALAQISLRDFPDGPSVEAFVSAHPAASGEPKWRAAAPTLHVAVNKTGGFDPVISERAGVRFPSGLGRVPIAAFSNGRSGAAEGVFGVFFNYELVACSDDGQCSDGYQCDTGLGVSNGRLASTPCVTGKSASCVAGPGFCQDRGTNRYDASTDVGRLTSLAIQHAVGVTTSANPTRFNAQPWTTFRFFNATARTVSDFDPARTAGQGNDYMPADGDSLPRSGVLMWGRPQWVGVASMGRDLPLYLLWAPMPVPDSNMAFEWRPRYFAGLDREQRPKFSERETDAQPLDLDAQTAGEQPAEAHDCVGQMNVTWVPGLQQFVMFYGGDSSGFGGDQIPLDDLSLIQHDPQGSLWVRFAAQPWGPWSAPLQLMAAGDRSPDALPSDQYAEGGILAHSRCRTETCARYEPAYTLDLGGNNNGALYAPSFVDAWTMTQGETTSLYWLVSTWNPYENVLMRTTLRLE